MTTTATRIPTDGITAERGCHCRYCDTARTNPGLIARHRRGTTRSPSDRRKDHRGWDRR